MPTARAASKSIAASISTLAANDLESSDTEMDLTLVDSDTEEEFYDSDFHRDDEDSEKEESSEEEEDEDEEEEYNGDSDEEDDEDDDEEEDEDGPVVLGKRKRGRPAKKPDGMCSCSPSLHWSVINRAATAADSPPPPRQIEYTTSIYSPEQLTKPKSSRGPPESDIFSFMSNEPWSNIKSRIRKNIRTAFNLNTLIDLDDYKVSFTIPRHVKDPIVLNDSTKYEQLLTNALKIKTHPTAKIIVEPKAVRLSVLILD